MIVPEVRPRLPLAGAALAACAGIVVADWAPWPGMVWAILFAVSAIILCWKPRVVLMWLCVALAFATLHEYRHGESPGRMFSEQLSRPAVVRAEGVVITEPEKPEGSSRFVTARFRLRLEKIELHGVSSPIDATVQVKWNGEFPAYGDRVEIRGTAVQIPGPRNPGQFDFRQYAARQGVYTEITAKYAADCRILAHGCGNPAQAFAWKARQWIHDQLASDLTDEPAVSDLIASMVLGMRGDTPDEIQDLFRATGTLHLFAVSGLNVAMLGGIVWFVLKPLRVNRRFAIYLTIPLLALYALITGLAASCVRASIMGSLLLAGFIFERPPSVFNSLAAAALAILAWDTNQFFAPGFQFSFVLVIAIAWMAKRIEERIEPVGRPDEFLPKPLWGWRRRAVHSSWKAVAGGAGVTMAAWFGSLAFTAQYFHLLSLSAIGANMLAVPIAFAILALGLFTAIAAPVSGTVAALFNNANFACTKALLAVVQFFAAVPGGHTYVEAPSIASSPLAELTVFDLGEGGATHLRAGGRDLLIDCGNRFEYDRIVLPYLRSRGVNHIDALILTHGDAQHIGAAQSAWSDLAPGVLFDIPLKDRSPTRKALHSLLVEQNAGKRFAHRGETLLDEPGARIEVLFPPTGLQRSTADDKALVLRATIGNTRILLTSDAGFATEQWLLQNEPDLHADILVKGWHAKDTGGAIDFLSRVRPQIAVVAAPGIGNGVATATAWVEQASSRGVRVMQQGDTGAVQIRFESNGQVNIAGFLDHRHESLSPR